MSRDDDELPIVPVDPAPFERLAEQLREAKREVDEAFRRVAEKWISSIRQNRSMTSGSGVRYSKR